AVMPPVPPGQPGQGQYGQQGQQPGGPEDPHPWQNQLRAARDRNEQTQVQYLDPNEDPLRRRPQRQVARPQPQQQPPQRQQRPQQRPPQGGYGRQPQQQPQQYAPQQQPQRYAPPPQPERPAREPRQPRQRSANPMKIPGLGCLKGCLFTIVILFVASWLIWELSPLQEWIGTGKSYWQQIGDIIDTVSGWIGDLGGKSSGQQ
ncbi:serine/threonine protein kinase, partial [Streptomyces canus]